MIKNNWIIKLILIGICQVSGGMGDEDKASSPGSESSEVHTMSTSATATEINAETIQLLVCEIQSLQSHMGQILLQHKKMQEKYDRVTENYANLLESQVSKILSHHKKMQEKYDRIAENCAMLQRFLLLNSTTQQSESLKMLNIIKDMLGDRSCCVNTVIYGVREDKQTIIEEFITALDRCLEDRKMRDEISCFNFWPKKRRYKQKSP